VLKTQHRRDNFLFFFIGLAELAARKYKPAARNFLQASFDNCECPEVRNWHCSYSEKKVVFHNESHLQSQANSVCQSMVLKVIGQFSRDGNQQLLVGSSKFPSVYCWSYNSKHHRLTNTIHLTLKSSTTGHFRTTLARTITLYKQQK